MRTLIFLSALLLASLAPASAQLRVKNCELITKPGIKLGGRVKVITKGVPTFHVRIIPSNGRGGDVQVKVVKHTYGRECGVWQFVDDDREADFTVKFVDDEMVHFTIRFVESMEGST
jgi:hypothetical protein